MKLFYIANARIPTEKAHGIQIAQMLAAFANSKLEVELVVPRRLNKIKQDPFKYYGIENGFKITKLPCLDLIPWLGHFGLWIETVSFLLFLLPYILFKESDIIYTRDKSCLFLTLFRKNVLYEAHTFPQNYFLYSGWLKRTAGIITITNGLKALFIRKGVKPGKILTVPDAVDLEKFAIAQTQQQCRERLGLPFNKKIVLYTGHLYKWKGVDTLLEAAKHLSGDAGVYLVGGTEREISNLKSQISNLKLNNVLFVGHRPHTEIPYWLGAADVLVLPNSAKEDISRSWTSPLKLFEYMASKKPIVASDLPSLREVLNEQNAVLVRPDDPEDLAQGIKKVLCNEPFSQKIASRAFQDVQGHTWSSRAKKILEFIPISLHQ